MTIGIDQPHVYVQSRAGLAGGDFRSKGHIEAFTISEVSNHPFGEHELVSGIGGFYWEKFYLVLLIYCAGEGEVPYLRVAIFDLTAGAGYVLHASCPEVIVFGKRC